MHDEIQLREHIAAAANPLGLDGIEYIEFTTPRPQALGQLLESVGFRPVARHRSREVLLYRQGPMNIVVNAHAAVLRSAPSAEDPLPAIRALALRVRDARSAYERALEFGAWDVPMHAQVMELNIPGIHGPGGAHIYFVDRYREFSIYSVDFIAIPGADPAPPASDGLHFFGLVQYIGRDRTDDWVEFYARLLGFARLGDDTRFGILPSGTLMQSPGDAASRFYLQLIEPDPQAPADDAPELYQRIGFGTPDVPAAVASWRGRGIEFVDSGSTRVTAQGAITRTLLDSVSFELVHDQAAMNIEQFGMDTISLAGPLEAKLRAIGEAGFAQVMLSARDIVGHPQGLDTAVQHFRASGLRGTGFQVLRDFEGLSGGLHAYKVDIAKSMIEMCAALGCKVLLACSSTSRHASEDSALLARDLRKLAMLALPHGVKVAYEALSWGRTVNRMMQAWALIEQADCANLGIGIDSFHLIAAQDDLDDLHKLDPQRIYLVQLSDFMWQETPSFEERINTARTFRVFPGEGVHSEQLARLVVGLNRLGYRGDYSFEVFNDDYQQLPLPVVAERARNAAVWLAEDVLRRSVPLPGAMRLRR